MPLSPNFPDLRDIVRKSPYIFVNVDEFVDFPRPIFMNVIYIGGLFTQQQKGLIKVGRYKNKKFKIFIFSVLGPHKIYCRKRKRRVCLFFVRNCDKDQQAEQSIYQESVGHICILQRLPIYSKNWWRREIGIIEYISFFMNFCTFKSLHKFAENISNVYITHWAPQIDLLGQCISWC